jgi:hypothetical protein
MDPNATLAAFLASLKDGDKAAALEAAEALTDWLRRGGFMPAPIGRSRPCLVESIRQAADATDQAPEQLRFGLSATLSAMALYLGYGSSPIYRESLAMRLNALADAVRRS